MPTIFEVADAVKEVLNAETWSLPFTAERLYQPLYELADMKTLHVTVVPRGTESETIARSVSKDDVLVDVAVQKKLAKAEIDPLLALAEEIGRFFRFKTLVPHADAAWVKTKHEPILLPEHLRELRQFTSVLTFTFRVAN